METSPQDSDKPWIERAQAGDASAFARLVALHAEPLLRSALSLCHDHHQAEDIAQDTLTEAWRCLGRFDGRCRFSTWLFGILRHRFLKSARRRWHDEYPSLGTEAIDEPAAVDQNPALITQAKEDATSLRHAVAQLPEGQRAVMELRFFADASLEDIAVLLDIPLGTVKSRLHHGLQKLRQQHFAVNLCEGTGESPARKP